MGACVVTDLENAVGASLRVTCGALDVLMAAGLIHVAFDHQWSGNRTVDLTAAGRAWRDRASA